MKTKSRNKTIENDTKHTGSICLLCVMSMVGLLFYSMMRSSGSRFEQLFVGMIFVFGVLPICVACSITYFIALVNSRKAREDKSKAKTEKVMQEKNKGKIPSTEGYLETRDFFKFATQKGRLGMEDYFTIKDFIIAKLGDNYKPYENVQWKNDSHCIYSMLKNSKLTTEDYRAICDVVNDVMGNESNETVEVM